MADTTPMIYTPLQSATFNAAGLVMAESQFCAKVIVRANFEDGEVCSRLQQKLQLPFDLPANQFVENDDRTLFWLGPDERIVYSYADEPEQLVSQLKAELPKAESAAVDVSDYYTVVRVAGNNAQEVLSCGTPLDIHDSVFAAGACAQTRFGQASMLISRRDSGPVFDLQVRWSFADYVWRYLQRVSKLR